jgi:COMPASS component SWD3
MKSGELVTSHRDLSIRIWNLETKLEVGRLSGHLAEVRALIQLPSADSEANGGGGHLASGSCDSTIKIWNETSGLLMKTLRGHLDCVNDLTASLRHQALISCSEDTTLKVWHLKSHLKLKSLNSENLDSFCSLLLLINNNNSLMTVASGASSGTIMLWNGVNDKSAQIRANLYGHISWVTCLVQLENVYLASASWDSNVKIWNYETAEEMNTLLGHRNGVMSIVCLKNGHLASASRDYCIKIWNYTSGYLIVTFDKGLNFNYPVCLILLKNGNFASASDSDIIIWHPIDNARNSPRKLFKTAHKSVLNKKKYTFLFL